MYFWMEIHGVRCVRSFWFFDFLFFWAFFWHDHGVTMDQLACFWPVMSWPSFSAGQSKHSTSQSGSIWNIWIPHFKYVFFNGNQWCKIFLFFCDIIFQLSMIRRLQWIHWLVFGCLASHERYDIMIVMSWSSLIFFLCPPVPMFHHSASQWSWGYRIHWRVQMASTAKKICVCMCTLVKLTMIFMMYNMYTTLHSKIIHSCEPMFRHMELIRGRVGRPSRHCMICMLYFTVSNISNPIQPWLMWNKCKYIKYKYLI